MSISSSAVSTHPISAQFIDVAGRRVLVRFAGSGPAVLLLHQSPQNSRALIAWIERLSAHYSVFAPDTPGFGYSDPLPLAQPTIPDYAAALSALLDALGIERVIVNGVHTGAVTALRFALDFPARVAGLICDGYARFNAEERQLLLNGYLPPFEPQWDGSHLLWLWARLREQHLFFPWNTATKSARMAYPAPSTERLSGDVLDILDAGDGYRAGYRAPFLYDDATAASRLTVETCIFYRAEDVLVTHLPRLQGLPTNVVAEIVNGGPAALIERTDAFIASHAANASRLNAGAAVFGAVSTRRRVFDTTHGSMCALIATGGGRYSGRGRTISVGGFAGAWCDTFFCHRRWRGRRNCRGVGPGVGGNRCEAAVRAGAPAQSDVAQRRGACAVYFSVARSDAALNWRAYARRMELGAYEGAVLAMAAANHGCRAQGGCAGTRAPASRGCGNSSRWRFVRAALADGISR